MKIDFVIPWVDGNDPHWKAEKAQYLKGEENDSNSSNRYRDWNLMKYWFRSVERFTPWVNKIHFITWGHIPEFLNTSHPKINIVRHEEFMPPEALPTFSSHALEINIHRINGLADHFVYLNDDTFILREMPETSFFVNSLPCTYGGEEPLVLYGKIGIWQHAAVNDLGVVNAHFNKREAVRKRRNKYVNGIYRWKDNLRTIFLESFFPDYFTGFRNLHAPAAYLKKTFFEVWKAEPELLLQTTRNRFRTSADVNQWVMLWWQIAGGTFAPTIIDSKTALADAIHIDEICEDIKKQRLDMICINDPEGEIRFEELSLKIQAAFKEILPDKSGFEK